MTQPGDACDVCGTELPRTRKAERQAPLSFCVECGEEFGEAQFARCC